MRRFWFFLLLIIFFILAIQVSLGPLSRCIAAYLLKNVFVGARVKISTPQIHPFSSASFFNLGLSRESLYDFRFREISLRYNLASIVKGRIRQIAIRDASLVLSLRQRGIEGAGVNLHLGTRGRPPAVERLELSGVSLDLRSQDFRLKGKISLAMDLVARSIDSCCIEIESLEGSGFQLSGAFLSAGGAAAQNRLYIESVQYDKLKLEQIQGRVIFEPGEIIFSNIAGRFLEGKFSGDARINLRDGPAYLVSLNLDNLDLSSFIKDAELEDKVAATGRLTGSLNFKGTGIGLTFLDGGLYAEQPGGALTIKDDEYLKNIASSSHQPMDLLVESFRNYQYNIGKCVLRKERDNLILDISLEGGTGKRELTVVVHDFGWLR
jgi:hypothetical protein